MRRRNWLISVCVLAISMLACKALAGVVATATPLPTYVTAATPEPTWTPAPTVMAELTSTTESPSTPEGLDPVGTPASEWKGIPIMPGALAGQGDDQGYTFTIQASQQQITQYYTDELGRQGWTSLANGEGQTGAVILIFMKDQQTVSIMILPREDKTVVMIVK